MNIQKFSEFNGMANQSYSKGHKNVNFTSVNLVKDKSFIEYYNSIYDGTARLKLKNAMFLFEQDLKNSKKKGSLIVRKMFNRETGEDVQLEMNGKKMGFFTAIFKNDNPFFEEYCNIANNLTNTFNSIA